MFVPAWYCLRVAGRTDSIVRQALNRCDLKSFRPERHIYSIARGKEVKRELNLFPGYIFVQLENLSDLSAAANAQGVAYVLGNRVKGSPDRKPVAMPESWLNDLIAAGPLIEGKKITHQFQKNQRVKLVVGALTERIARIDSIDKAGRLCLEMDGIRVVNVHPESVVPDQREPG